jgi:hypothetical protein
MPALYGRASTARVVVVSRFRLLRLVASLSVQESFPPRQLISGRVISSQERRCHMHSSVHYREPKGKGHTHFYSKPKLVEARYSRVSYIPSLLFSYPRPVALCYNHKNLSSTLSRLLDVVSRFARYSGVGSLSHSKRKCISIHVFSPLVQCQVGHACPMPGI